MSKRDLARIDRLGRGVAGMLDEVAKLKREAEDCYEEKRREVKARRLVRRLKRAA